MQLQMGPLEEVCGGPAAATAAATAAAAPPRPPRRYAPPPLIRRRAAASAIAALLLIAAALAAPSAAAAAAAPPPCDLAKRGGGGGGGDDARSWAVGEDCAWSPAAAAALGGGAAAALVGDRGSAAGPDGPNSRPATVTVSAAGAAAAAPPPPGAEVARLELTRLVLDGFDPAPGGGSGAGAAGAPLLWPLGLAAPAPGAALNMTDVRVVVRSREAFSTLLNALAPSARPDRWTDGASFVHVQSFESPDGRTGLRSVGVLLAAGAGAAPANVAGGAAGATNVARALEAAAGAATPAPLLVYVAANASLGARAPAGIAIRRPVVLVGLQSLPTSLDFMMDVNQLNETGSRTANLTFVGLALENLAPGDADTSAVAAPFSIAVTNNVWAAFYNR